MCSPKPASLGYILFFICYLLLLSLKRRGVRIEKEYNTSRSLIDNWGGWGMHHFFVSVCCCCVGIFSGQVQAMSIQ